MSILFACVAGAMLLFAGLEFSIRRRALADSGHWRTRPLPAPDHEATRLVVLGDSITYAPDLDEEEAWPALLAARLTERYPERRWQVINAGVCGNTVADAYARFHAHVHAFQPHMVLIAFGLNDCRQVHRPIDERRIAQFERNEQRWWGRSYLFRAIANRLNPLPAVDYASAGAVKGPRIAADQFRSLLAWLVRSSERLQAQPVLLTPTPVSTDLLGARALEFAPWPEYGTMVRDTARALHTPFIELSHPFATRSAWADDGVHLSAVGEAAVAERVWQALQRPPLAIVLQLEIQASNAEMAPSLA